MEGNKEGKENTPCLITTVRNKLYTATSQERYSSVFMTAVNDFLRQRKLPSGYQVSYCPAQRALKMLEKDGLIKLCRGKATQILAKPYEDYLGNPVFLQRSAALLDLCEGLKLISPAICFHSLHALDYEALSEPPKEEGTANAVRSLYRQFDQALHAIGSQTALNLYYDVGFPLWEALFWISSALPAEKKKPCVCGRK